MRQNLYLRCLNAMKSSDKTKRSGTALAISPFVDEMKLVAPDPVLVAVLKLIDISVKWEKGGSEAVKLTDPSDVVQTKIEQGKPFVDARKKLLVEMRRDVLNGSRVPITLTDIEDIIFE